MRRSLLLGVVVLACTACDSDSKQEAAAPTTTTTTKTTSAEASPGAPPEPKPGPTQHFRSRPDLKPVVMQIKTAAHGTAPGYVFLAPKMAVVQAGPMIMDNAGQVVWFHPLKLTKGVTDFRVQRYKGKPVLTWWRGRLSNVGVGDGYYVIYDTSYRPVAEVRPGKGLAGDVHEFVLSSHDTALMTIYHRKRVDLTAVGGPKSGLIWDGIVQEVDIPTGRVLFEWHSYPGVGVAESYSKPPKEQLGTKKFPYDYIHLNSIHEEPNGNLLISGRNTHTVYEVDRKTGKVLWRLGGKKSNFKLGQGVRFAWQHDARRQHDGTITIFDNGAAPPVEKFSRVLVIRADEQAKSATLIRSYKHPKNLLAPFEGNAQFLPSAHVFVGWGGWPYITEFDKSGKVLFDVYFGHGKKPGQDADTYRAYRMAWRGEPRTPPDIAVSGSKVYVSWNGATNVARWRLMSGDSVDGLEAGTTVKKSGFETAIPLGGDPKYVAVQALGANGRVLATSNAAKRG
ncbi:MAG: arylsulfotransferase family protein [Gaiellaceae bacterium]